MACEFKVKDNPKVFSEQELKAYLLDGGLKDFIDNGLLKIDIPQEFLSSQLKTLTSENNEKSSQKSGSSKENGQQGQSSQQSSKSNEGDKANGDVLNEKEGAADKTKASSSSSEKNNGNQPPIPPAAESDYENDDEANFSKQIDNFELLTNDEEIIRAVKETHKKRSEGQSNEDVDYARLGIAMQKSQQAIADILQKAIQQLGIDRVGEIVLNKLQDDNLPLPTRNLLNTEIRKVFAGRPDLLSKLSKIDAQQLSTQSYTPFGSRQDWLRDQLSLSTQEQADVLSSSEEGKAIIDAENALKQAYEDTTISAEEQAKKNNKTTEEAQAGIDEQKDINKENAKKANKRKGERQQAVKKLSKDQKELYRLKAQQAESQLSKENKTIFNKILNEIKDVAKKCG